MRLEFTEMSLTNFGSFAGTHTLKLNEAPGLLFVRGANKIEPRLGPNGAGKSTLLNALCWCLYGKTTNGLISTDIRPWSGKGKTSVKLSFSNGWDGGRALKHVLTRTANPNSLTLDEGIPQEQEQIDSRVGMSFEVFRQTIMLGQGRPLFHDLPNREKLQFLSDVLDLDRWDRYSQVASDAVHSLEMDLSRCQGEAAACSVLAEEMAEQVKKQDVEYQGWEKDRTAKVKELDKRNGELAKRLDKVTTIYADFNSKHDMGATNLKIIATDLRKAEKAQQEAALERHSRAAKQSALQRQLDDAEGQLKLLAKSKLCPTCKRPITDKAVLLQNRKAIEATIHDYIREVQALALEEAEAAVKKAKATADRLRTSHDTLDQQVSDLANERSLAASTLQEVNNDLKLVKVELGRWESDVNPHRARLQDLRRAQAKAVSEGVELQKDIISLEAKIERRKFWIKGFKDIRLFVLNDVLEELEFVTNNMLDDIGLVDWEVRYDVERETKSGTTQRGLVTSVLSPSAGEREVKWTAWSGGEGQRLRLVGALALSQVLLARAGVDCNIEVLDEPTRHLSTEGVEDLCEFLARRATDLERTIWLVDHKAIESSYFNKVVTVTKTSKGSSIA